jgi:hypothetical protein
MYKHGPRKCDNTGPEMSQHGPGNVTRVVRKCTLPPPSVHGGGGFRNIAIFARSFISGRRNRRGPHIEKDGPWGDRYPFFPPVVSHLPPGCETASPFVVLVLLAVWFDEETAYIISRLALGPGASAYKRHVSKHACFKRACFDQNRPLLKGPVLIKTGPF